SALPPGSRRMLPHGDDAADDTKSTGPSAVPATTSEPRTRRSAPAAISTRLQAPTVSVAPAGTVSDAGTWCTPMPHVSEPARLASTVGAALVRSQRAGGVMLDASPQPATRAISPKR